MPKHTLPDYTTKYKLVTVFGQADNGELAARLGSINVYDRRGHTVWMDDFENGVGRWSHTTVGTGATVTCSAARFLSGGASCLLTAGSDATRFAGITTAITMPVLSQIGIEFAFLTADTLDLIRIDSHIFDGTNHTAGSIWIDITGDTLDYGTTAAAIGTFNSDSLVTGTDYLWHKCKFVVDYSTGKFVRFMLDNVTYDLSAYSLVVAADARDPYLLIGISNTGTAADNDKLYIDDVIVTQNE